MEEIIRVGIVGAGRTGTPLIREFLQIPYTQIKVVCDLNSDAEGMKLAQEKGIFTTADIEEIVNLGEEVDLVINVTGDPNLRKKLIKYYLRTANTHTLILHELTARLLVSLATRSSELMKSLHPGAE